MSCLRKNQPGLTSVKGFQGNEGVANDDQGIRLTPQGELREIPEVHGRDFCAGGGLDKSEKSSTSLRGSGGPNSIPSFRSETLTQHNLPSTGGDL